MRREFRQRLGILCLLAMCLTLFAAVPALAAGSTRVDTVTIGFHVEGDIEAGTARTAYPTAGTSKYMITDWSCSTDPEDWQISHMVTFDIRVEAVGDYWFAPSKTTLKTSGANASVAKKTIKSDYITCKINYWPTYQYERPLNLYFEDEDLGKWDKVKGATQYEVKIHYDDGEGKDKTKTVKVDKNQIDLSPYDNYTHFEVRAIPKNTEQKKYAVASEWSDSDEDYTLLNSKNPNDSIFKTDKDGNTSYVAPEGEKASGFVKVKEVWYYMDPQNDNNMAVSSWREVNGKHYWFDNNGAMQTGWIQDGHFWYYLENNPGSENYGAAVTGWYLAGPDGPWYYFNDGSRTDIPFGAMYTDCMTPDGYRVDKDGKYIK